MKINHNPRKAIMRVECKTQDYPNKYAYACVYSGEILFLTIF